MSNSAWGNRAASKSVRSKASPPAPDRASAGHLADRATQVTAEWAPTAARVLLGLVLAWFGYHELMAPQLWTGYVPVIAPGSGLALAAVLVHGWVLLMLAVATTAGVVLRLAAAVAALLLVQIVVTLTITGGLTDLTLRDVGVLGLAVCLTGGTRQRAVLTA